ncbi:hypothetical protein GZH47_30065 [Paenibacillus rhizovicinus]|uniref:Uncharacterized protein n=1 Tax=Paenibacillus rhizovicinus TaxID=2704463 RepID=A0A6C0P831_9BACL|nr:DUF6886 family protein [Paenibacillus rhizovicinus]QHW34619.1 hypothetical protein GZH47_30065 [Paenibacillus rhizovicinus]
MRLYHFSEDPNIQAFTPRQLPYRLHEPAMVWAIDEWHAYHYYFPRDCPRVCFWPAPTTSEADRERFFGLSGTHRVIAVESGWLDRIRDAAVFRYEFDTRNFEVYAKDAGYYIAKQEVVPLRVERVGDCLGGMAEAGIEVRITPSLQRLREAIPASSVNFSMIRMSNARTEMEG